jgi:hypothetical protein
MRLGMPDCDISLNTKGFECMMKRFDTPLISLILKICEEKGCIKEVGPEYYNFFLTLPKVAMKSLISCIVFSNAFYIKRCISDKKWTSDEQIFKHVKFYLELIALGIMEPDDDFKLGFVKPSGPLPDKEMEEKLDEKIRKTNPIIGTATLATDVFGCMRGNRKARRQV